MTRFADPICNSNAEKFELLRSAVLDGRYLSLGSRRTASPHEFYRYPARFTPAFARAAIEAFTNCGDLVIDPFVGGGTTLVEARLAGRMSLGSDLNSLAVFVSQTKSRPHSVPELIAVTDWIDRLPGVLSVRGRIRIDEWNNDGYFRNIDTAELAGVRSALSRARSSLASIDSASAQNFARLVLLRVGQWALDMRDVTPSRVEFTSQLQEMATAMVLAAGDYRRAVRVADQTYDAGGQTRTQVLEQALPGLTDRLAGRVRSPKLIVTSPPYPGVYVNYHRWKVLGRRETPALYWLVNRQDGNGQGFYTMSARSEPTLNKYFGLLEAAYRDVANLASEETIVVQMVGFHEPETDLPRYLEAMERSGLREFQIPELASESGRLWRDVPNRRWWVQDGSKGVHTAKEVVLFHRKSA